MEYRYKYLDNVIMLALRAHMYLDNGMFCKSWIGLILPFSLLVGNIFVGRVEYAVAGISNRSRLLLLQEQRD
jgi:hypothetical protein